MDGPATVILLAVLNGEKYIADQIRSIQRQTSTNWRLIVRDDASSDATVIVVRELAAADGRIALLPPDGQRLGSVRTFATLLQVAYDQGARHLLLADHDDVWLPTKIQNELRLLGEVEIANPAAAALVHSDLEVVNADLQQIHRSYRGFEGISYNRNDPLETLLLHNAVVGCTTAFNRRVLDLALPFPSGVQHDWWLAQCTAVAGVIADLPEATVLYRQHGGNEIGTRGKHAFVAEALRGPRRFFSTSFAKFAAGVRQAQALRQRLDDRPGLVEEKVRQRVAEYCRGFEHGRSVGRRLAAIRRSGVRPQRALSQPIFYSLVAAYPAVERRQGAAG